MDKQTLRKLQLTQLEIAMEIKRICVENNIPFFMDFGTLLGAVRHKGFIPWDDDMDFGMERSEYNRFIDAASHQLRPEFFLQTWDTDAGYGNPFAKIRMNNTLFAERVAQHTTAHNGIYVDIFPYDNCPLDKHAWKKQKLELTILKALMKIKNRYEPWNDSEKCNLKRWIKYLPIRFAALFTKRQWLIKKYEQVATRFNVVPAKRLFAQDAEQSGNWVVEKKFFYPCVELPFENVHFPAPKDYDGFLAACYGDYMQPPPVEKRYSTHGVSELSFDTKETSLS